MTLNQPTNSMVKMQEWAEFNRKDWKCFPSLPFTIVSCLFIPMLLWEMESVHVNPHWKRQWLGLGVSCCGRELLTDIIFGKKDKTPASCLASKDNFPLPVPKKFLDTHLGERRTSSRYMNGTRWFSVTQSLALPSWRQAGTKIFSSLFSSLFSVAVISEEDITELPVWRHFCASMHNLESHRD